MTNQDIITELLKWEGSKFTDDPLDRGGATKFGITQRTLSRYAGIEATREDVKNLTEEVARKIYLKLYIEEPNFDKLTMFIRHFVVDCGVNHGTITATKWLQEAAGVSADGIIGPKTLLAVNGPDDMNSRWINVFKKMLKIRIIYYAKIVRNDPSQSKWLVGWMRRATSFLV